MILYILRHFVLLLLPLNSTLINREELFHLLYVFELYNKGIRYLDDAKYGRALDLFRRVQRVNPEFIWAYVAQADCYFDLMRLSEAATVLENLKELDSSHHIFLTKLGWLHYLRGELGKSIEASSKAVTATYEDSLRSIPYHNLGTALLETGVANEALKAFLRSVVRANVIVGHCFGLANALDVAGKEDKAKRIHDRTVEVAQWRLAHNKVTPRMVRTVLGLDFIRFQTANGQQTFERVRRLLQTV